MKKISLVLVLMLVLVFTFSACNNADKTTAVPRWGNEELNFTITMANITTSAAELYNNEEYLSEPVVKGYEINPLQVDEITPYDLGGTYKMNIELSADELECTFTTEQTVFWQYPTSYLTALSFWTALEEFVADDDPANPLTAEEGYTVLKTTHNTLVTFKNIAEQTPLHSHVESNGFFFGKNVKQNISKYTVDAVYDWDKKQVTVDIDGTKDTHSISAGVIDANQILLYMRSLEKTPSMFKDSPSVKIYLPLDDKTYTATFVYTYTCNSTLGFGADKIFMKVNALAMIIDGRALVLQLNVPDKISTDVIANSGGLSISKYTPLRFRSRLLSYQRSDIDDSLKEALQKTTEKAQ